MCLEQPDWPKRLAAGWKPEAGKAWLTLRVTSVPTSRCVTGTTLITHGALACCTPVVRSAAQTLKGSRSTHVHSGLPPAPCFPKRPFHTSPPLSPLPGVSLSWLCECVFPPPRQLVVVAGISAQARAHRGSLWTESLWFPSPPTLWISTMTDPELAPVGSAQRDPAGRRGQLVWCLWGGRALGTVPILAKAMAASAWFARSNACSWSWMALAGQWSGRPQGLTPVERRGQK